MNSSQWLALINNMETLIPWNAVAGPVVSSILNWFKHLLAVESAKKYKVFFISFTGEQVMLLLLVGVAAGVSALYRQLMASHSSLLVIPLQTILIWAVTQPWYFFILKPIISGLNAVIDSRVQQKLSALNPPAAAQNFDTTPQ